MNYSNQTSKLDQLNPTLLQNLSDEQASTVEGGVRMLLPLAPSSFAISGQKTLYLLSDRTKTRLTTGGWGG